MYKCEFMYTAGEFWTVEIGKDRGSYSRKYDFLSYNAAYRYYSNLNIFNGYKKRLVYHNHPNHLYLGPKTHDVVTRYIS